MGKKSKKSLKNKGIPHQPVFSVSQSFTGGGYNLTPATVDGMGTGGAGQWEFSHYGDLNNQWKTVMDINSKTLGNSFDLPNPNVTPTPAQQLLAQSGGRRRRGSMRKRRHYGGNDQKPIIGGDLQKPIIGGSRRKRGHTHTQKCSYGGKRRSKKHRGGTGYRQL